MIKKRIISGLLTFCLVAGMSATVLAEEETAAVVMEESVGKETGDPQEEPSSTEQIETETEETEETEEDYTTGKYWQYDLIGTSYGAPGDTIAITAQLRCSYKNGIPIDIVDYKVRWEFEGENVTLHEDSTKAELVVDPDAPANTKLGTLYGYVMEVTLSEDGQEETVYFDDSFVRSVEIDSISLADWEWTSIDVIGNIPLKPGWSTVLSFDLRATLNGKEVNIVEKDVEWSTNWSTGDLWYVEDFDLPLDMQTIMVEEAAVPDSNNCYGEIQAVVKSISYEWDGEIRKIQFAPEQRFVRDILIRAATDEDSEKDNSDKGTDTGKTEGREKENEEAKISVSAQEGADQEAVNGTIRVETLSAMGTKVQAAVGTLLDVPASAAVLKVEVEQPEVAAVTDPVLNTATAIINAQTPFSQGCVYSIFMNAYGRQADIKEGELYITLPMPKGADEDDRFVALYWDDVKKEFVRVTLYHVGKNSVSIALKKFGRVFIAYMPR